MSRRDRSASVIRPELSIVIPMCNEEATVDELYCRLRAVLVDIGRTYEIIFVDDGSHDDTYIRLSALRAADPRVRLVKLARNYGQTAALAAGFDRARAEVIVAMDGDLQHAPEDLPRLLSKLDEGYDVVSGWREHRVDGYWTRRLPSQVANWLIAKLSGVPLHDFGHIQSVSGFGHQADCAVRRSASIHSGACDFPGSEDCGSADHERAPAAAHVALRAVAHLAGDGRPDNRAVPAAVLDCGRCMYSGRSGS